MARAISYIQTLAAATQTGTGGLVLFGVDVEGQLWCRAQAGPGGRWSDWAGPRWNDQQAPAEEIACAGQNDGRLMLLIRDDQGWIWSCAQTRPSGDWGEWEGPRIAGQPEGFGPICAGQESGARGIQLWGSAWGETRSLRQEAPGGRWGGWELLDGELDVQHLAVGGQNDGCLMLCASADGQLWANRQLSPGGGWSGWQGPGIGPRPSDARYYETTGLAYYAICAAEQSGPGGLQLWALDADGETWSLSQDSPGGRLGPWRGPGFGGQPEPFQAIAAAGQNNGCVMLVGAGYDGGLWQIAQSAPSGSWGRWIALDPPPGDEEEEGIHIDMPL